MDQHIAYHKTKPYNERKQASMRPVVLSCWRCTSRHRDRPFSLSECFFERLTAYDDAITTTASDRQLTTNVVLRLNDRSLRCYGEAYAAHTDPLFILLTASPSAAEIRAHPMPQVASSISISISISISRSGVCAAAAESFAVLQKISLAEAGRARSPWHYGGFTRS